MMRFLLANFAALLATSVMVDAAETLLLQRSGGGATPVKVYAPSKPAPCPPVVILSHGFGGDVTALSRLAGALSGAGHRVLVMGHRESGRPALKQVLQQADRRGALAAAVSDKATNAARLRDLDTVAAFARKDCTPPRMILGGHSMGAQLTMIEAGAKPRFGLRGKNRFDAYVALSPQGVGDVFDKGAWAGVTRPVLMVTGTKDNTIRGGYETRLNAFAGLPPGYKRLAVIDGAGHMHVGTYGPRRFSCKVNAIVLDFLAGLGADNLPAPRRVRGVSYRQK